MQSKHVLKWQAEGKAQGKVEGMAEALLRLLELRFPAAVPDELTTRIRATTDLDQLDRWLTAAVKAPTLDAFRKTVRA